MRASAAYRLIVSRGARGDGLLGRAGRTDRVEVVGIDEGEVVLMWEGPPDGARRVAKALRADLAALSPEEFVAAWHE